MINSTFDPKNENDFEKAKLIKAARGVCATIPAGTIANIDLVISDDMLVLGGYLLVSNAGISDTVTFQVLAGSVVVAEFISNWYVDSTTTKQDTPTSTYPAKLFAGLTLRVIYHSTGASNVWCTINYNLEKVLI